MEIEKGYWLKCKKGFAFADGLLFGIGGYSEVLKTFTNGVGVDGNLAGSIKVITWKELKEHFDILKEAPWKKESDTNHYEISISKFGKLASIKTPDGGFIENIVKDSIGFYCDNMALKAAGKQLMKLEIFINDTDVVIVDDEK